MHHHRVVQLLPHQLVMKQGKITQGAIDGPSTPPRQPGKGTNAVTFTIDVKRVHWPVRGKGRTVVCFSMVPIENITT